MNKRELILNYLKNQTNPLENEKVIDLLMGGDKETKIIMEIFWIGGPEVKLIDERRSMKMENDILSRIDQMEGNPSKLVKFHDEMD